MNKKIIRSLVFSIAFGIAASSSGQATTQIPLEYFVREPSWQGIELSPDGTKLLAIKGERDVSSLVTYDIFNKKYHIILKDTNKEWRLSGSKWLDNEHFMLETLVNVQSDGYRMHLDQQYIGHYSGDKFERIIRPKHSLYPVFEIVNWLENDPDHFLVSSISSEKGPGVFRYNIDNHRLTPREKEFGASWSKVISYSGKNTHWVSDASGRYFAGIFFDKDKRRVYFRDNEVNSQLLLWEYSTLDFKKVEPHPKFVYPMGFEPGKPVLYVRGLHDNREALYKVNLSNETQEFILVAANDRYDLSGSLITSPKDGRPVGIFHNFNGLSATYWDSSYASLKAGIDKALPGSNAITSVSLDENKYIVLHTAPNYPGAYFLGNRTTKALEFIGSWYPELIDLNLPKREKFEIQARDGLSLEVFVTSPGNSNSSPLVVIPHSDPFGKDIDTFDLMPTFLATRGYTVLQVNYRGSHGYGLDFFLKSKMNFGLGVQNDIEDATRWLIKERSLDAKRVCIMGKKFGGYSALMGLANTSNLYKCGISFAGITDLVDWSNHNIFVYGYDQSFMDQFFGGRWSDRGILKESSPINLTEKIVQPLLILHGERDIVVPVEQSKKMVKKLKKHNKDIYFLHLKEGDHSINDYAVRKTYYEEVEKFLAKYL